MAHLPWAHASVGYSQTLFQNNLSVFTNESLGILKMNCNKLKFCQFLIIHCYLFAKTEIQTMAVLHSQVSEEDVINTVSKKMVNVDNCSQISIASLPVPLKERQALLHWLILVQLSQHFQYRQEHIIFDSLGIIFYKKKLLDSSIHNDKILKCCFLEILHHFLQQDWCPLGSALVMDITSFIF